jgi:hypothetical protein
MTQIQLNAGMGAAVIAHLRQFGELPETGIVAGQAVSSAIQDLFGDGRGQVYNDVDIFRELRNTRLMRDRRRNTLNETVEQVTSHLPGVPRNDYGGLEEYLTKIRSYQLSSVSTQGKLNYVNCVVPGHFHLTGHRVIDSFDLNCTRAAVDLQSGQLSWDRHFERFLSSRQLEIVAVHTPWHTLLRLLKKAEELPDVYVDIPTSAELCAALAQSLHANSFVSLGAVSNLFGDKAHALAQRTRSQWEPYFELTEKEMSAKDGTTGTLYSMKPRGEASADFKALIEQLSGAAIHYAGERLYGSRRKLSGKTLTKMSQVSEWAKEHDCKQISYLLSVRHDAFVAGNISQRHVEEVGRLLKKHPGLMRFLSPFTLERQLEISRALRKRADEHGQWVYGVFETDRSIVGEPGITELQDTLDAHIREKTVPFNVKPLALDCLPRKWARAGILVEELLTGSALDEEGEWLSHCVGGYANQVRTNMSRIIRIRTGSARTDWSTMEVRKGGTEALGPKAKLSVMQHRGFANRAPSELNKEIAGFLLAAHGKSRFEQVLMRAGMDNLGRRLMLNLGEALRKFSHKVESLAYAMKQASSDNTDVNHALLRREVAVRIRNGGTGFNTPQALPQPVTQD